MTTQYPGELHPAYVTLDELPRARLCSQVTPIELMANLTEHVGGAPMLVKRDDLTPLATGGNKVRQLEFYLGEAHASGADTVLITGAVQSNFVMLTAAAARRLGMECHVQLEERVASTDPSYRSSGNVLLDRLFGAVIHHYPTGEDEGGADANLEAIAEGLVAQGRRPYVIHLGIGHPSLGALGYVDAARELVAQVDTAGIDISTIVVASGSGATHAGLLFGIRLLEAEMEVVGACVRRDADAQIERITRHCESLSGLLAVDNPVRAADVNLDDRFLAPGYGKAGQAAKEAIRLGAHCEGLILDPVYTAKSMACAIDRSRSASSNDPVLWFHTGGKAAIFAYESVMLESVSDSRG